MRDIDDYIRNEYKFFVVIIEVLLEKEDDLIKKNNM